MLLTRLATKATPCRKRSEDFPLMRSSEMNGLAGRATRIRGRRPRTSLPACERRRCRSMSARELVETLQVGMGYAITEEGEFQLYISKFLPPKPKRRIARKAS